MGALTGYKVLDLSILVQGPQAAAMLHDLGAEVTKIELPEVGDLGRWLTVAVDDDRSPYVEANNRGKRSVTLDLRTTGGKKALLRLVETTDVLIHNFVPGTTEEWGIGYQDLTKINPKLMKRCRPAWETHPQSHPNFYIFVANFRKCRCANHVVKTIRNQ